jgi:hypothetical protein
MLLCTLCDMFNGHVRSGVSSFMDQMTSAEQVGLVWCVQSLVWCVRCTCLMCSVHLFDVFGQHVRSGISSVITQITSTEQVEVVRCVWWTCSVIDMRLSSCICCLCVCCNHYVFVTCVRCDRWTCSGGVNEWLGLDILHWTYRTHVQCVWCSISSYNISLTCTEHVHWTHRSMSMHHCN